MKMTETEIVQSEWQNTGTSWTRNQFFEENGFLVVKNICDPKKLFCPPPEKTGKYIWWGKSNSHCSTISCSCYKPKSNFRFIILFNASMNTRVFSI